VYIAKNIKSLIILRTLLNIAIEEEQYKWLNNEICEIYKHIIDMKIL
jgi:hypothetical protein